MISLLAVTAMSAVAGAAAQVYAARQQQKAAEMQAQIDQMNAQEMASRNEYNLELANRKTKREASQMITRGVSRGLHGSGLTLLDNVKDLYLTNEENKYWMNRDADLKIRQSEFQGEMTKWSSKQKVTGALINLGTTSAGAAAGYYDKD